MSIICENCGEKLDDKANYCMICGEPVKREKMVDQEDYQWSMSLKEVIDSEFDEALNQTGIRVESKNEKKKRENVDKLKNKANKEQTVDTLTNKKKPKIGVFLFIAIGVILIGIGGIVVGLSTGIIDANLIPFSVVNKMMPTYDSNVSIQLVKGVTEDGQPMGSAVLGYSVNTASFTVFGTIEDEEAGTPINVSWKDVTEDMDIFDQVVYLNEKGEFYATLAIHAVGYAVKGVTRPGDYSVIVTVDDKTDRSHEIDFKVASGVFEEGEVNYINDMYMVAKVDDETYQAIEGYDGNPEDILLEVSYIDAPAKTKLIDKWYYETNEWEEIDFVEPLEYWVLTEETRSYVIDLPPLTPVDDWKEGNYRVELYTEDNQLAGATEFYLKNYSQTVTEVQEQTEGQGMNISEMYLTEEKAGNTVVDVISANIEEIYCYYNLQGVTNKAKLTWVLGNNKTGKELTHKTDTVNKNGKYLIQISSETLEQVLEPGTYYISIYEGDYQADAKQLSNIVFRVQASSDKVIADIEQEGEEITVEEEQRIQWNEWLTVFVDSRLPEMYLTTSLTKEQLIDFAVMRNFIGKNTDMFASLDSFDMYWLTESDVNYTIDWLLDESKIEEPVSTDLVYYDAGSYGVEQSKVEALPKRFAQVTKAYDALDNYYVLYFNVYEAPHDFDGDLNGNVSDWASASAQPVYLGEMMATYEELTEPELGTRWVLRAFQWEEKSVK